jgi:hypothetical protein
MGVEIFDVEPSPAQQKRASPLGGNALGRQREFLRVLAIGR